MIPLVQIVAALVTKWAQKILVFMSIRMSVKIYELEIELVLYKSEQNKLKC